MGSSVKRKKEKKQDFQKPKLKVGKAKPKPANQTDTSFRSKAIVLNQQSLTVSAPTTSHQFQHHVSLLSSRSDTQRKESLAYLTTFVNTKSTGTSLPIPIGGLLDKICPLILDGSNGVRGQLLKLFQSLKAEEIRDYAPKVLPFARAGMTHLSRDIRQSTVEFLSWLLEVAGEEVVSCPGGWIRTLESFITLLGWKASGSTDKWSSNKSTFGSDAKLTGRVMQVLAQLLRIGFSNTGDLEESIEKSMIINFPLWHVTEHALPNKSNAYSYLDLFSTQQAEENSILEDPEDRTAIFNDRFRSSVATGIEIAKQEGGELGRAAGVLTKSIKLADRGG